MKSVSYADEKKWERLQRMRRASKKKSVRDKVEEARLKGLEKASVLDASDDPADQDKAREIRVMHDYASLKKQIGSKKKPQKPAVEEEVGISSTVEMDKAKKEAALRRKEQQAVDKEKKALKKEDYDTQKKGEVLKALDKKKFVKRYGKEKAPDIMYAVAAKTAKRKGDTSKSDDRYAYEEVVNETVSGGVPMTPQELEIQKKMSRLNMRLARKRNQEMQKAKVQDTETAPEQVKEDKAFRSVVDKLKKKYPGGVLSSKKDFEDHRKREAAKPKPKAKPQKPLSAAEKAHREVIARYGSEANYKAGRGLGT